MTDQRHVNYLPSTHTRVAQFMLCMIFLMYVATIQHLNYSRQESKQEFKKAQFAAFISNTLVTLKQRQGHQTSNENVDSKQGYDNVKFERSPFNGV